MMYSNSVDLYEAVLKELNQDNAPSFEIDDFLHYFNKAIEEYTNLRYKMFELNQQTLDDLSTFKREVSLDLTLKAPLITGVNHTEAAGFISALSEYKHTTAVVVQMVYVANKGCNVPGDFYFEDAKRLDSDKQQMTLTSYYHQPNAKRLYYKIVNLFGEEATSENEFVIMFDVPRKKRNGVIVGAVEDYVVPSRAMVHYIKTPDKVTIAYDIETGDIDLENSSVFVGAGRNYDDVVPYYVWNEIIKICVTLFLEQQERGRVQSYPIINRTIN